MTQVDRPWQIEVRAPAGKEQRCTSCDSMAIVTVEIYPDPRNKWANIIFFFVCEQHARQLIGDLSEFTEQQDNET